VAPYREDLEAALAHAESLERDLAQAREDNAADRERITALEQQVALARSASRPKGEARAPEHVSAPPQASSPVPYGRWGWFLEPGNKVTLGVTVFIVTGWISVGSALSIARRGDMPVPLGILLIAIPLLAPYFVPWLIAALARRVTRT
jgi:hypothetical protein